MACQTYHYRANYPIILIGQLVDQGLPEAIVKFPNPTEGEKPRGHLQRSFLEELHHSN